MKTREQKKSFDFDEALQPILVVSGSRDSDCQIKVKALPARLVELKKTERNVVAVCRSVGVSEAEGR